jgi:hypothetical protein
MRLKVDSYSGYKADQRPLSFTLNGRQFKVREWLDAWYGPDHAFFKVRADDCNIYILKHSPENDEWTLEMYRQGDRA